ncbi:MAG: MATE family efflux transporter [Muribaculaceae bacterium]|nr:MATE family efflux transporter [Muribaculaceae bacterium]
MNKEHYKQIIRLGLPIIAGQAGMIIVAFADNIMVGQYSTEALASASFVNNVFNMAMMACLGFTYGLTPLVGALFSTGKHRKIGELIRNGLMLNLFYSLLIVALMSILYANLHRIGQPEELLPLIRPYYILALVGIVPVTIFNALGQAAYGMQNTGVPMWIILFANLVNIFGNWLLIYGNWGFPEMGLTGAGLSTLFSRILCPLLLGIYFISAKKYREVYRGGVESRISRPIIHRIASTSFPVSMQLLFETAAFSGAAVMAGWLGKIELAAFQVMVTIGTLGFCFYYSLGSATSVLVANAAGRENFREMRRIGFAGYHLILLLALAASAAFIVGGRQLIGLFTHDPIVITACMTLIAPLVIYQLGDATQVNFANSLRGTSKVTAMLWIALFSYIIVGLPTTYFLRYSIQSIFYSFSASLFVAAGLFLYFFLKNTREKK